jgi:hypothetical protein
MSRKLTRGGPKILGIYGRRTRNIEIFFPETPYKNIEKIDGDAPDKILKTFTVRRLTISPKARAKSTLIQVRATSTESLIAWVFRVVTKKYVVSTLKFITTNNRWG